MFGFLCAKPLAMGPVAGQEAVLAKAQWFAPLEVLCDGEAGQNMREQWVSSPSCTGKLELSVLGRG